MAHTKTSEFSNFQIVTLATFLVGGGSTPADIEDIAMQANQLAPGRFAWRKYPEQINISQIASALSDARKEKNGHFVDGSPQKGWMLTSTGLSFAQQNKVRLKNPDFGRKAQNPRERNWQRAEQIRLQSEPAFLKFHCGQGEEISRREAEAFFRLDDYVVGKEREKKIVRFLNVFGDDAQFGEIVRVLSKKIRA
jgi:hypothetical protein